MNATMLKTGFAAAIALCPAASFAESDADVQTKLVALTQALMDALVPGEAAIWQKTLAENAVIVDEFGRIQNKKEAVESVHPFPQGLSGSIEIRDAKVHVDGDTAVLQGEMYEKESVFGQALVVRYIFANTFVRDGADWKLLAATDVTLPTEPPKLDVAGLALADYPGTYRYGPKRAFSVALENGALFYTTKPGGPHTALEAIGKDVFMSGGDERNLVIFWRHAAGKIDELIERRKFNDLHMKRDETANET